MHEFRESARADGTQAILFTRAFSQNSSVDPFIPFQLRYFCNDAQPWARALVSRRPSWSGQVVAITTLSNQMQRF